MSDSVRFVRAVFLKRLRLTIIAAIDVAGSWAALGFDPSSERHVIRLATSSNITSVAPPPIACTRASRDMRSIVDSLIKPSPP